MDWYTVDAFTACTEFHKLAVLDITSWILEQHSYQLDIKKATLLPVFGNAAPASSHPLSLLTILV